VTGENSHFERHAVRSLSPRAEEYSMLQMRVATADDVPLLAEWNRQLIQDERLTYCLPSTCRRDGA